MAKAKLTKAEYEALTDPKAKEGYELVGEFAFYTGELPDVASLTSALESERTLHQTAANQLKAYTGIDPVKAKEALAAAAKAGGGVDTSKFPADVQAALNQIREDLTGQITAERERSNAVVMDRAIETVLIDAGVIREALPDAMDVVRKLVKPLQEGDPSTLGVIGPQGTFIGTDFKTWAANDLKKAKSWFFADNGVGGTGGSQSNAVKTPANVTQKTRAEFDTLSPADKITFSNMVDQGKAALVDSA